MVIDAVGQRAVMFEPERVAPVERSATKYASLLKFGIGVSLIFEKTEFMVVVVEFKLVEAFIILPPGLVVILIVVCGKISIGGDVSDCAMAVCD